MCFKRRLCIPEDEEMKNSILRDAHATPYYIRPGSRKMYTDLKQYYWWSNMMREVVEFFSRSLTCQQVKIEYQQVASILKPLPITEWK